MLCELFSIAEPAPTRTAIGRLFFLEIDRDFVFTRYAPWPVKFDYLKALHADAGKPRAKLGSARLIFVGLVARRAPRRAA
jgi:hypothetical protein